MLKKLKAYIKKKIFLRKCHNQGIEIVEPISINNPDFLIAEPPCYIGPDSWLSLRAKFSIGSGTIIGPRLKVHTSNHRWNGNMLPYDEIFLAKQVVIEKNVWIGADVTLMSGVRIGEGAIVAACSCVTKDVPPMAIVAGVPATIKKYRDNERYEKLLKEEKIYLKIKRDGKLNTDETQRIQIYE